MDARQGVPAGIQWNGRSVGRDTRICSVDSQEHSDGPVSIDNRSVFVGQ